MRLTSSATVGGAQLRMLERAHGERVAPWLSLLRKRLPELADAWDVQMGELLHAGVESIVLGATGKDGRRLVIKMMIDGDDFAQQLRLAPRMHSLHCVPKLVSSDAQAHALLMQRADGAHPADPATADDLMRRALDELHAISGQGCRELEAHWMDKHERTLTRAGDLGLDDHQRRAIGEGFECLSELIASIDHRCLLHGDLHAGNVLVTSSSASLIDAWGMDGPPQFDIATWLMTTACSDVSCALGRIGEGERPWVHAMLPSYAVSMQNLGLASAPLLWDLHAQLSRS
jgi:streptomycin 6-kinase